MVLLLRMIWIRKRRDLRAPPEASGLEPKLRATGASCAVGAHQVSSTSWRLSTVAQAVQIPKQAPEGSRWGPLDSLEHTDFSQLASRKPS